MTGSDDEDFDVISDLCINACQAVLASGSAEMRALARLMLYVLARETIERMTKSDLDLGNSPNLPSVC